MLNQIRPKLKSQAILKKNYKLKKSSFFFYFLLIIIFPKNFFNFSHFYPGNEYPAVVEYAIYQKIPQDKPKQDSLCSTIKNDEYYLRFLENLKTEHNQLPKGSVFDFNFKTEENKKVLTPLLKYISEKKREKVWNTRQDKQASFGKKNRESCVIFVNSAVKKHQYKHGVKYGKSKHYFTDF